MNISAWSIRNPVPAILLFLILTTIGLFGLQRMHITANPDVNLPVILVSAHLEGAAPEQLENQVARKLEDKVATVSGIETMRTAITDGNVSIRISFDLEKNGEQALSEVRNAVDAARAELPGSVAPPVVTKSNNYGDPLLSYIVQAPNMSEIDMSWLVDHDISKALTKVRGVSGIQRIGGVQREVQVNLDPVKLAGLGLSATDVSNVIAAIQRDDSGGLGAINGQIQSVRTFGARNLPEQLAGLSIPIPVVSGPSTGNLVISNASHVRLNQIARVVDTEGDHFAWAAKDGRTVVGFGVVALAAASEVEVAAGIHAAVAKFNAAHPAAQLVEVFDDSKSAQEEYDGSMHLLYEGAALAILVVWWFLRDGRSTLIAAAALPLSVIPTFGAMYFSGFTLNSLTLLGLSLVVGVLVDDAIVELENIVRHLRMGKAPLQAATDAANEIGLAVVATTLTLVAVFLPTAFMSGINGRYFRQFGITVGVAVVVSLMVARLLTPVMAAYGLKSQTRPAQDGRWMRWYLGAVERCLRYRVRTGFAALAFVAGSLFLSTLLPTGFIAASDDGNSSVTLTLAPGSTLQQTQTAVQSVTRRLLLIDGVTQVFAVVGDAGGDAASSSVNQAQLAVRMMPRGARHRSKAQIEIEIEQTLSGMVGLRAQVDAQGGGSALEITLVSDDAAALNGAVSTITKALRAQPDLGSVQSSVSLVRPEIHIAADAEKMAEQGVTTATLANMIRIATYGDYFNSLAKLNLPQRQVSVRVQIDPDAKKDLQTLGQLRVSGRAGSIPLSSVATLSLDSGSAKILRRDRMRYVTISIATNGRAVGEVANEVRALAALRNLPAGVRRISSGDEEQIDNLMSSFGTALCIGLLCIYAVLTLLFHDFMQPLTIMAALPLSLGGAIVALMMTRHSLDMAALIGLLMLTGIVTKNSIMLVEYVVMARRELGMARGLALLDACHKRARPVLMTTLAMGAGMLPVAFGIGPNPSFRAPMAIAVIGGLATSTCLSLLVIPVLYTFIDDLGNVARRVASCAAPDQ